MIWNLLSTGLLLVGLLCTSTASAEARIALVIGNGRYAAAPLTNPVNDAVLIRDTLKGAGFTVRHVENADRGAMVRSIQALGRDLAAAGRDSVGLFYFSGHGVQSDGRNYLLPIGGQIDTEADLLPEAIDADWVLKQMEQAGNPLNIVILDACRNNTLAVASKSATKGLARMVAPVGSVVAFATDSGTVAYDGRGRNSPYAAALAKFMAEPGLEMEMMFKQVARQVFGETAGQAVPQIPVQLYKLTPTFYFRPGAPVQTAGLSPVAPPAAAPSRPVPSPGPGVAPSPQPPQSNPSPARAPSTSAAPALSGSKPFSVFRDCTDCPEMVRIPQGTFRMGDLVDRYDTTAQPVRTVTVSQFGLSKFEITHLQWAACVAAGGCPKKSTPYIKKSDLNPLQAEPYPVRGISWNDAQAYIGWLSRTTGHTYRLPTEAEWEFAARAGTETRYFWGDDPKLEQMCLYANSFRESGFARLIERGHLACDDAHVDEAPVGTFKPNSFGLYDMIGNVDEWVEDCWAPTYESNQTLNPVMHGCSNSEGVVRGGSFLSSPSTSRAYSRGRQPLEAGGANLTGLRVAVDIDK